MAYKPYRVCESFPSASVWSRKEGAMWKQTATGRKEPQQWHLFLETRRFRVEPWHWVNSGKCGSDLLAPGTCSSFRETLNILLAAPGSLQKQRPPAGGPEADAQRVGGGATHSRLPEGVLLPQTGLHET